MYWVCTNFSQLLTSLLWNLLVLEKLRQSKTKKQRLASQFLMIAFWRKDSILYTTEYRFDICKQLDLSMKNSYFTFWTFYRKQEDKTRITMLMNILFTIFSYQVRSLVCDMSKYKLTICKTHFRQYGFTCLVDSEVSFMHIGQSKWKFWIFIQHIEWGIIVSIGYIDT